MRPTPLTAAVMLFALGATTGAKAQLPATPQLPTFGKGLFGRSTTPAPAAQGQGQAAPAAPPTLFSRPPGTLAGREATLQVLQDCYAREAPKVKTSGAADTRIRRLRQLCENEEIADTRAWLKWSKIGRGRSPQRILNALQQDDAEKALGAAVPATMEKP